MKKIVIIAAAGKGNRLGAGMPKCLVEINGKPIFMYLLDAFSWADEIRMVVGFKSEEVISRVSEVNNNVVFVHNEDYANTTTLQSNFLGAKGIKGKVLFIDGDMIISKDTAKKLFWEYEKGEEFIGVASDISENPVYAGVENEQLKWFSYEKKSNFEWANVALLDTGKLEYNPTHFFVQIQKFLPIKAVEIDRVEVDTPEDLEHAKMQLARKDTKLGK